MSFWEFARRRFDFWFYSACAIVGFATLSVLLIAWLV